MIPEQENASDKPTSTAENNPSLKGSNNDTVENSEEISDFCDNQILSAEHTPDEITNNDGSVIETLDTDFHNQPGHIAEHSLAGSNRAEYYEKRSQGKSDTEEEQEYMRNHQQENDKP